MRVLCGLLAVTLAGCSLFQPQSPAPVASAELAAAPAPTPTPWIPRVWMQQVPAPGGEGNVKCWVMMKEINLSRADAFYGYCDWDVVAPVTLKSSHVQ